MTQQDKKYMNMPDTRSRDAWGNPIGNRYEKKDWYELTPEEMMADFDWKSDVLLANGEEVTGVTFYQDYLFRELYTKELPSEYEYKVLITEYDGEANNKVHKVDIDEIQNYFHLNDVALSPCLFYGNWRRKDLLNYVSAFVLDIDELRPMQLQRFFELFEKNRILKPTFIANSGSGVHFYYLLDKMFQIDSREHEANNLIAEEIYKSLYADVREKEQYKPAQRHWIGQDYRVINSKTKLNQRSKIFKVGDTYTIEQFVEHYGIKVEKEKTYATPKMKRYAQSIAKDLKIDPPDFSDARETYVFISTHKDAAFLVREEKRKIKQERAEKRKNREEKKKNSGSWYRNTLQYMMDHTTPGHRFSAMKALAMIANIEKEKISRDTFMNDLDSLASYWETFEWKGDAFNLKNVEAIKRYYDTARKNGYHVKPETLEEWLGYEFKRIPVRRNGRKRKVHLHSDMWFDENEKPQINLCKANRELGYKFAVSKGKVGGRAETIVKEWRQLHPDGRKVDCIRDTGLSKPTVYKWWGTTIVIEPEYKELPDGQDVLPGQIKFK